MKTVARYHTETGQIPQPPNPAYVILDAGNVVCTLTADEVDAAIIATFAEEPEIDPRLREWDLRFREWVNSRKDAPIPKRKRVRKNRR